MEIVVNLSTLFTVVLSTVELGAVRAYSVATLRRFHTNNFELISVIGYFSSILITFYAISFNV